jgi:hypothetical protein
MSIFKNKKAKVTLKSEVDRCNDCKCAAEYPCTPIECYRPVYTITCVLNEKYWNEELKRYIAVGINEEESLLIAETAEITFTHVGGMYRLINSIQEGKINKVTITQNVLGTESEIVKGTVN